MTILNEDSLAYMMSGGKRDPFSTRRAFAQKLAMQGTDTSPVQSPWQGVGRLAQALAGAYGTYRADADEKQAGEDYKSELAKVIAEPDPEKRMAGLAGMGGQGALQAAITSTGQELTRKRQRDDDLQTANFMIGGPPGTQQAGGGGGAAGVIGSMEAGGRYDAVGPVANAQGHRAWGKFQVLEPNIGPWTKEVLGREMTPQEFLADQKAQDAVFNTKFGQYQQKYGPEGAARAWFAGEGGMNNPNAKDVLGTTVAQYGQKFQTGMQGQGGPQQAVLRGPPGSPTPIGTYTPGTSQVQLAQGSADGSGTPLPPQNQGGDPGAQYVAAAERAYAAKRGDLAIKFMQQATAAREAGAQRDANRTLTPREEGPDLVWYDNRTGQRVSVVPGGAKKAPGEAGAIPGQAIENQARNALVRAANDPAYRASPEYAAVYGNLSRPRIDANGQQIPPEDLSAFPQPTYRFQQPPQAGQQAPQGAPGMPPQQGAAMPPQGPPQPQGMPPAPNASVVLGPTMQGAPPPGSIVATQTPGTTPKLSPEAEKLNVARREAVTIVSALADFQKEFQKAGTRDSVKSIAGATTPLNTSYNVAALLAKGEELFNLGVLNGPDLDIIRRTLPDPSTFRGAAAEKADAEAAVGKVIDLLQTRLAMREKLAGQPMTDLRGSAKEIRATMPGAQTAAPTSGNAPPPPPGFRPL